ncbi:uncharacterized protein LOC117892285 [Drosophila subobscura]|uniref:uncharacterized protein LOC117892285 n=1 Tax=Drosophila subobscura TaxID=7241 RepID=UPI00155B2C16|nr:uncharacterized protein LOC117892285 [Drosophila subobscura]
MRSLTVLAVLLLLVFVAFSQADDSPGFFLKITKNVPRLGKRESLAMKNLKTIPRIGRSEQQAAVTPLLSWLWDLDVSQPSKRRLATGEPTGQERELTVVQPVNSNTLMELLDNNAIPSEHVKFVHWKDFDRALQSDTDLYAKVIQLGRRPDHRLKEDLNFSSYVPIFDSNGDQNTPFMMYNNNNEDRDLYGGANRYDRNFLKYNHL